MRKLAALALAGVFLMSGSALANEPGYYLQIATTLAPIDGPQVCYELPCEATVAQYQTVYVTVVVDCHKGEGFLGAFWGMSDSSGGTTAVHTGMFACTGFLAAIGVAPASSGASSTAGCQLCCTAVAYHSYLIVAPIPHTFSIVPHGDLGVIDVLDCNYVQVPAVCWGPAAINSGLGLECQCAGPTATEETSWGSLKSLYN